MRGLRDDEKYPINTPEDFKAEFNRIKRIRRFYSSWETSRYYFPRLDALISALDKMTAKPEIKIELLAGFFRSEKVIIEKCDDSNGEMTDIYHIASSAFARYAALCAGKEEIARLVRNLYVRCEYGTCETLLQKVGEFLPEDRVAALADDFWSDAERAEGYEKLKFYHAVETLARAMKRPELYEKACRAANGGLLKGFTPCDVAEVYLESGKPGKALETLSGMEEVPEHFLDRYEETLFRIYSALKDKEKMTETARRIFFRRRTGETFDRLVGLVGKEKKERMLGEEAEKILLSGKFDCGDAGFLIEEGRIDEAEKYVLAHAESLDGSFYNSLLGFGKSMEEHGRWLAAAAIYRALLKDVLARANSRYYPFGVRYLLRLDSIAEKVEDWKTLKPHAAYMDEIRETHKRKVSFWNKYTRRETRYSARRGWY